MAKNIGLVTHLDVHIAMMDKSDSSKGTQCLGIKTDAQVALEVPSIRNGTDTLQRK